MPSHVTALATVFRRLLGIGSESQLLAESTPKFEIQNAARTSPEGQDVRCSVVIQDSGGDCFNVGVLVGSKRITDFLRIKHGESRKVSLTLPKGQRSLALKILGFDARGSVCEQTFHCELVGDGIVFV